ncbi:hypothetical protein GOV12_06170 [Candidatus Pacearchaeota archaeon]|nr:hypothetical protein [Candidatus Pacearchaeota archaeon]
MVGLDARTQKLGEYPKIEIEESVRTKLPELNHFNVGFFDGGINNKTLVEILQTIHDKSFLGDAIGLLSDSSSCRSSVTYDVYAHAEEDLSDFQLQVIDTQRKGPSPHGYIAHIYAHNGDGERIRQLTLSNISL